jgi:hypothetical protein
LLAAVEAVTEPNQLAAAEAVAQVVIEQEQD